MYPTNTNQPLISIRDNMKDMKVRGRIREFAKVQKLIHSWVYACKRKVDFWMKISLANSYDDPASLKLSSSGVRLDLVYIKVRLTQLTQFACNDTTVATNWDRNMLPPGAIYRFGKAMLQMVGDLGLLTLHYESYNDQFRGTLNAARMVGAVIQHAMPNHNFFQEQDVEEEEEEEEEEDEDVNFIQC